MHKHLAAVVLAAAALAACEPNRGLTDPQSSIAASRQGQHDDDDDRDGDRGPRAVYTITNQVAGNAVVVFARATGGRLTPAGTFATGGTGTGGGLGSQGAVVLSDDGRWLFAVNAGSNDVSVLRVGASGGLSLASRTPSGGIQPTSVTAYGRVVYVLNAGGDGNITGFTLGWNGGLIPIAGSTRSLSGTSTAPAQVEFSPDGGQLIVAERGTNLLDVYPVDRNGVAGERRSFTSAGGTPFGFAFGPRNLLFVSEAAGSASSYVLGRHGSLRVASGAVLTHQAAPCWAVVTGNGRFGYTANTQGASISGFAIARDGSISLLDADGATAVVGGPAIDMALSRGSRYLYQLVGGANPTVHGFRVQRDGHLESLEPVGGLPAGTAGLAAF